MTTQLDLLSPLRITRDFTACPFAGVDITPAVTRRLGKQTQTVFDLMSDGQWRTLRHTAFATGAPEASVSARLRDLRKDAFGGHTVERRNLGNGLYQYRVILPQPNPETAG